MIWYVGQYPFWSSSRWDVSCCFAVTLITEETQEDQGQSAMDPWERLHLHTGEALPALLYRGADPCNALFVCVCVSNVAVLRCNSGCEGEKKEEEEEEETLGGATVMQREKLLTEAVQAPPKCSPSQVGPFKIAHISLILFNYQIIRINWLQFWIYVFKNWKS